MLPKKTLFLLASSLISYASAATTEQPTQLNLQQVGSFIKSATDTVTAGAKNALKQVQDMAGKDAVPFSFAFMEVDKLRPHKFDESVAGHSCRAFTSFEDMIKTAYGEEGKAHLETILYCRQSLKVLETFSASDIIEAAHGAGKPEDLNLHLTEITEALRLKAERLTGLYRGTNIRSNYHACINAMKADLKTSRKANENYPCGVGAACTDADVDAYKATLLALSQCKSDLVPSMPEQIGVFADALKLLSTHPGITGKQFANAVDTALAHSKSLSGSITELYGSAMKIFTSDKEKPAEDRTKGSVKDTVSTHITEKLAKLEEILHNLDNGPALEAVKDTTPKENARKSALAEDLSARAGDVEKKLKAVLTEMH